MGKLRLPMLLPPSTREEHGQASLPLARDMEKAEAPPGEPGGASTVGEGGKREEQSTTPEGVAGVVWGSAARGTQPGLPSRLHWSRRRATWQKRTVIADQMVRDRYRVPRHGKSSGFC